jgi:hypothetical protein
MALERAAKKIKDEDVLRFIKQICLEVFRRFILRTPVDTGRARGNWQVEIGKAAEGIIEEGLWDQVLERGTVIIDKIPPFSVVHITNNVEYVFYLEYVRRSKQHPEGMVEITLQEIKTWLQSVK